MSKNTKSNFIDMTKTGPLSYRQLRELNSPDRTPEVERLLEAPSGTRADTYGMGKVSYTQPSDGFDDFGSSTYDSELVGYDELVNRQDVRADRQPWYAKIGAGLAKGAILAGTTFLDGTIGLLVGGAEAISRGDISGLWDNDFSRAMQAVNEWSEEAMPNYYSTDELNSPWYENIFTANFIGDKFIKNLGFSVGALYSGGVTAAGLKLTKLPQLMGAITKSAKAPAAVSTLVGAATSAVNEGRIEALNNSKDWQNLKIQELDDTWRERLNAKYAPDMEALAGEYQAAYEEYEATKGKFQRVGTGDSMGFIDPAAQKYQAKIAVLDAKKAALEGIMKAEWDNRNSNKTYRKVVGKIEEDRLKMGNTDMLLNLPILMASNIVQFTKFYANGFNTARRAGVRTVSDAAEGTARYAGKSFSKGKAALKVTQGALAEGTEEISQKAASLVAGDYYSTDVNNFYKSQIDPDAEQETLSWMKSFASGINETVNDGSSWEEFFIGSLTGLIGVPSFRSMRNADGSLRSPVTLQGGAFNEIKDYMESIARSEEIANYLNQRVQSPEFLNYYRGMVRHNKYQADMNTAVEEDDEFNFKNAEHAQFVSDIVMFDNAGKLEDLRTYIDSAYDMSDENLQAIVENTTATDEDGKKVGPFVDSNGNPLYATEEGKQQMIEKLTQTRDNMISTLDNYRKTKNDLDIRTGGNLSNEQLSEMTWLKTQVDDWSKRASDMTPLVKKTLIDLSENLETTLASSLSDASMDGVEAIESVGKVANQLGIGADRIQQLRQLALMDDKKLTTILTSPKNEKFVKGFIDDISTFGSDIISALKKQNVVRLLQDLPKIGKGIETYNNKLEEYLADPAKVAASQAEAEESVRQDIQQRKSQDIRANLSAATSLEEFKAALDQEEDKELGNSIVEELAGEDNQVAKNYKETLQYDNELRLALSQLGEIDQTTQDALSLWQEQVNLAENLEQIANPNSVAINNEEAFMEDSGGDVELAGTRFENARYALQRAMSKVNNDIKFKNRFSEKYRKPIDEPVKGRGVDKDSTGDSGTPTVPHVNPGATPIEVPSAPVGNVTAEIVAAENSDANRRVETQRTLDQRQQGQRKYYRPAVPELHIEASKEGDFRPFDVVVAEREPNVDFSGIYSYLRDNGAFNYVNAAKLKPGDTLGFMIDPEFNDHTIFLVDTRNNQIVGSIDESDASVARYEGLENLIKKVRDEFENRNSWSEGDITTEVSSKDGVTTTKFNRHRSDGKIYTGGGISIDSSKITEDSIEDIGDIENIQLIELRESDGKYAGTIRAKVKDGGYTTFEVKFTSNPIEGATIKTSISGKFFATPQVRVSKMMVGRIPYTSEERSLADIPGVIDGDTKPIFGIIKNGVLTTNEKIDDRLIIKPVDMAQKEGRLYLLIPNAAGTYSPAAVRVKHFNSQEFNLDDATVAATPVGKGINEALDKLADATSQDDVSIAMKELAQDIYMQDVMVTWFDAKAGSGIVVSKKVRKPDGTYEMVTINGQEQIKEEKITIYFQNSKRTATINGMEVDIEAAKDMGADLSLFGQPRDTANIRKDILNTILRYNLPLQVSVSKINDSGYNNRVIKSNILTSNLREAKVIGSWFTTDYFDNQGNLQRAVSPASVKPTPGRRVSSPVGGREGVTQGTRVFISGTPYIVDLKSSIAINEKTGERRAFSAFNSQSLIDMAWAQETFGDATESSVMTENKIITPKGDVLDRNTGHYITGDEAQRIKDKIAGRRRETENRIAQSKRVIADIYENQKKVDKARTDKDYYYILEEDGQYHQYSRVHSRLGDNWLGERTETENSRRALEAGTAVDKVIRDFFTSKETPTRPETLSEGAFIDLITKLTEIKSKMEQMGETFMTNNIVLFQKYADGSRVAGEVDILSVDKNGNFKIYDVKTSRSSFSDRYFNEKSSMQRMSTKDYYTLQLSAYQNLFESQYGVRPTRLAILPFVLTYDKDKVNSITQEKGIPITYNPAVNVPLASAVHAPATSSDLPIFDSAIETMITKPEEQNRVLPENAFEEGGEIGYYEKDGKLYTGYLKKIGEIEVTYDSGQKDMVPIHVTKVRDRGFGRKGEFGASSEYITVFPNGKAISTKTNDTNDNHAAEVIMKALSAKPEKVLSLSSEKTQIHNPMELEESDVAIRTAQESTPQGGASKSIQKNDSVNQHDDEFEDDLVLRAVDSIRPTWNREKEMSWLEKTLPQLSKQDRVKVVEGLIQVAENGPVAWGMFSNGVVTLSDIAAEGTVYHEAFHVVFNLMLTAEERESLLAEARQLYGDKSELSLEEDMAEGFREYVASQESRGLGRKILDFFKNLFAKVTNWKYMKPSLTAYYRMINQGRYRSADLGVSNISRLRQEEYTPEMQSIKDKTIADGTFMKAPNGNPTNLTEKQWLQVRTKAFKEWFGDWEKFANITEEELQAASLIFDRVPELAKIGTPTEYAAYIKEIFPNSVEKEVYWHGSNEDFSEGFASAKRGEGSGALETKKRNDLYLNKQGWASLQYVNGINRKGKDKNGFAHWNKLWWELKEIMSNGRRENNDWKDIVIDESTIRQAIPNKKGVFNRDSGGKNGKWLSERKADYGYENKSDKEFFEDIFGIKLGKDTFNTWTARNAEIFKSLEKSAKGINPVVIDVRNPIIEEGQNTYYEEQRGLFTTADAEGNDAILSKKADNEFNSDVAVVINANNDNIYWLGTKSDIERFRQWKANNNASKVVDENGEPLVVYHGSKSILNVFDPSKSESRQYLSKQIKPTNFFSSDKTVADFFALTENQSLASQISKSISIVLDAFSGENIDGDILDDEIWTDAARRTGKSKEFVKDFWENKVPREYKMYAEFGTTRMEDPDINKYKYNVFLNMKSPIILDAKGERADRFIEANKEVLNNNDEVIIINIDETVGKKDTATDYLVRNPNKIKSATDNIGTFSTTNDDIRYRVVPNSSWSAVDNETKKSLEAKGWTQDKFNSISQAERDQAVECIGL